MKISERCFVIFITYLVGFLKCPNDRKKTGSRNFIYPENRLFKSPEIWNYEYPIAGYGTVCMLDDSDEAWGMLFESEAWPLPFRVK